jgi:hypothetical protein
MSNKHNKHNEYNKTERYLREDEAANKQVGGQGQNQVSNKIGQADIQKNQGAQHKEHGQHHEKNAKKSDIHKK